jgi:hypothetical protein
MNIALPNKSIISSFLGWFVTWLVYCIVGITYLGYPMKGVGALGYQIVISEETVERIASYKADLIDGKAIAGKYLGGKISGLDYYECLAAQYYFAFVCIV